MAGAESLYGAGLAVVHDIGCSQAGSQGHSSSWFPASEGLLGLSPFQVFFPFLVQGAHSGWFPWRRSQLEPPGLAFFAALLWRQASISGCQRVKPPWSVLLHRSL